jgi:FixJ family two-component response regulator
MRTPTILLVSQDLAVGRALAFALELEGYTVESHAGGEALLRRPALPEADCLVVDHARPGLDGIDLVNHAREQGRRLPAVVLATLPDRALRLRAAAAGVPLLEKPLLGEVLVEGIQRAVCGYDAA